MWASEKEWNVLSALKKLIVKSCVHVCLCVVTVCIWHIGVDKCGKGVSPLSLWIKTRCPFTSCSLLASLVLQRLLEKPDLAWCYCHVWALRALSFPSKPEKDYSSDMWIAVCERTGSGSLATGTSDCLWASARSLPFVFSPPSRLSASGQSDCTCSELGGPFNPSRSFSKSKGPVPLLVELPHGVWGLFCSWSDHNYLRSHFLFCLSDVDQKWKILRCPRKNLSFYEKKKKKTLVFAHYFK